MMDVAGVIRRVIADEEYAARLQEAALRAAEDETGKGDAWTFLLTEFGLTEEEIARLPAPAGEPSKRGQLADTTSAYTTTLVTTTSRQAVTNMTLTYSTNWVLKR